MSNRLDQEREARLQPIRVAHATKVLTRMGFEVHQPNHTELQFYYQGHLVCLWPYSGWHTGKTIQDGRGLEHLTKQLTDDRPLTAWEFLTLAL